MRTVRPKLGVFFKIFKIQLFCCFITQLVKKLQQWPLYEVKEDILPFVLNTKRLLSDIWLLRYKQNSFGCFRKNSEFRFFSKTPKTVLLITHQQNFFPPNIGSWNGYSFPLFGCWDISKTVLGVLKKIQNFNFFK